MNLTPHQQQALDLIKAFLADNRLQVFVLKGYAGTGKTTLIGILATHLTKSNQPFQLLATTGRAAKVLTNKTGYPAKTIHSFIFDFDDISGEPEQPSGGQLQLNFDLRSNEALSPNAVIIVDEASMISHEPAKEGHTAKFGSGRLLHDLFLFAEGRKIIFVGDPCQLPPVADNPFSSALHADFLTKETGASAKETELTEIIRQKANSEILKLAMPFRESLRREFYVKYPQVRQPSGSQASLINDERELIRRYVEKIKDFHYQEAIMIAHANWQVNDLNQEIRSKLFPYKPSLQPNDLLLVVQNSYDVDLANGDQILLESAAPDTTRAGLTFLKVQVKALHNDEVYQTLLIKDLLYNKNPGLTPGEAQGLLIDFHYRMKEKGINRKSEAYKSKMMTDPYLNALRAKFGYAMTCHKAQGGEWPHLFLNVHKSLYGLPRPNLYRWYYTALTRAQQHLYLNDGWWVQGYNDRHPFPR